MLNRRIKKNKEYATECLQRNFNENKHFYVLAEDKFHLKWKSNTRCMQWYVSVCNVQCTCAFWYHIGYN